MFLLCRFRWYKKCCCYLSLLVVRASPFLANAEADGDGALLGELGRMQIKVEAREMSGFEFVEYLNAKVPYYLVNAELFGVGDARMTLNPATTTVAELLDQAARVFSLCWNVDQENGCINLFPMAEKMFPGYPYEKKIEKLVIAGRDKIWVASVVSKGSGIPVIFSMIGAAPVGVKLDGVLEKRTGRRILNWAARQSGGTEYWVIVEGRGGSGGDARNALAELVFRTKRKG